MYLNMEQVHRANKMQEEEERSPKNGLDLAGNDSIGAPTVDAADNTQVRQGHSSKTEEELNISSDRPLDPSHIQDSLTQPDERQHGPSYRATSPTVSNAVDAQELHQLLERQSLGAGLTHSSIDPGHAQMQPVMVNPAYLEQL